MGRKILTVRVAGLSLLPATARRPLIFTAAVRRVFARERSKAKGEVNIVILDRERMRAMNREFLGHDRDTDVIAFQHEALPGVPDAERAIGDIYISSWLSARHAEELGHSVLHEALTLAVHGALHLLGHDDSSPRGKARMFRLQDEILAGERA